MNLSVRFDQLANQLDKMLTQKKGRYLPDEREAIRSSIRLLVDRAESMEVVETRAKDVEKDSAAKNELNFVDSILSDLSYRADTVSKGLSRNEDGSVVHDVVSETKDEITALLATLRERSADLRKIVDATEIKNMQSMIAEFNKSIAATQREYEELVKKTKAKQAEVDSYNQQAEEVVKQSEELRKLASKSYADNMADLQREGELKDRLKRYKGQITVLNREIDRLQNRA